MGLDKAGGIATAANDNEEWRKGERLGVVAPSGDHVSKDAAAFIALHGMGAEGMSDGLREVAVTIPIGRPDLLQHWQLVARRIKELVTAGMRRTP